MLPTTAQLLDGMTKPVAQVFVTDETDARRVIVSLSQSDFIALTRFLLEAETFVDNGMTNEEIDHLEALEATSERIFGVLDEAAEVLVPGYAE